MSSEEDPHPCYVSPKLEVRQSAGKGNGLFAREAIHKGELLLVMGGDIITPEKLSNLSHTYSIQIEDNLYITPIGEQRAYKINHSCNPAVGPVGQITFVALRDIAPNEEVCYDYAMTDGGPYDEFECHCGASICRGKVTGNDWMLPDLWARYAGHFTPYLQRRIDQLHIHSPNGVVKENGRA